MNLQPLDDRIVVLPNESEETTASGLVIPDTAKEKPQQGKVLAVGPGRRSEQTGEIIPLGISVGDTVVYSKYGGTEITIDGEELLILTSRDVLAIVGKRPRRASNTCPRSSSSTTTRVAALRPASTSSRTRCVSRSVPRAATSLSTRSGAPPRSPTTASPSPVRSSSKTPSRTWVRSSSRKSRPRPTTSPATAPPPPRSSRRRWCTKAFATWPPAHRPRR